MVLIAISTVADRMASRKRGKDPGLLALSHFVGIISKQVGLILAANLSSSRDSKTHVT